jgi:glutamyl-tRNA(Gln) amidotransferase subunit E
LVNVNYQEIGLKVGLEIHQQLDTKHKLFCSCPTELSEKPSITFTRILRPTQSELGQVDQAALFEFKKEKTIEYEASSDTSCLVEMDEEPPHRLNEEAIDVALTVSLLMHSKPVDEIHVMRKIVIDGSNTTGFQRTCVVSLDGVIGKEEKVGIQHVSVEEDAARKISESGQIATYRIDRLGIPLIEIATAPSIKSPEEAEEVALEIGRLLRATRRVKRGLGTIRQDLNISTKQGALIEIKGVQKLELIAEIVEGEVARQLALLKIRNELKARGVKENDLKSGFLEVSEIFAETKSKVLSSTLKKGGIVLAVILPRYRGLLGAELQNGHRLGTEMAQRAVYWGGVGGIFHTDELPNYGISQEEVLELRKKLNASEDDAVAFVVDSEERAHEALRAVIERARECLIGVPEETRAANDDGTSRYMRPRPGAARMYPETDVSPVTVTEERLSRLRMSLPAMPDDIVNKLTTTYKINRKLAEQLVNSDYLQLFENITRDTGVAPSFVATALTEIIKSLSREGVPTENLSDEKIIKVFKAIDSNITAKEAVPDLLKWLAQKPESDIGNAVDGLGLATISDNELRDRVNALLERNTELLKQEGGSATRRLMNMIMSEVRGKVEAKKVSEILREQIARRLGKA